MKRVNWMLPLLIAGLMTTPLVGCGDEPEDNNTNNTNNGNNTNNTNNTNGEVTNALSVADQDADPANEVVIASVTSDVAGFVVIHEDDAGAPGAVIGNASVSVGESTDVKVTLDRDAVDGETLHAMLHVDDPADGEYTFDGSNGEDGPALDADGAVVVEPFEVSVGAAIEPSVEVADQTADPANEVVIAKAVIDGPGFVVIHEDDAGAPGPVIGFTALTSGDNTDVKVTLDRDAVDGETLHAMLHEDTGVQGTYEFDGANDLDLPVKDAADAVVMKPFVVTVDAAAPTPSVEVTDPQQVVRVDEVIVAKAVSDGPGFIVIHEDDGGAPGPVIGNTALTSGDNTDVSITLDRTMVEGETLYAMLHTDTGVIGTYEFDGSNGLDGPVTDENGDVITPGFVVDLSAAEGRVWAIDQVSDPLNEVVVPRTFYVQDGFIVIHEQGNDGSPGAVLGNTALPAGYNADVKVTLDRDIIEGETLFAMLHTDAGVAGTYEFPGPDGPVTDLDGDVITPSFVVNTPVPRVTQTAKTLAGVSTRVTVDSIYALADGFVVIHEDDAGSPGPVIGHASVSKGANADIEVILERPAADGETLHAMLHVDDPVDGVYTFDGSNGEDGPVVYMGSVVNTPFTVSVPAGLPAVVFTFTNVGSSAYQITAADPAAYESWIDMTSSSNPTLTLRQGWRYTFDNTAVAGHPLELGDIDETPPIIGGPNDVAALSQNTDMGVPLESDADIDWIEAGAKATFTLTSTLAGSLDGYVCAHHSDMRGTITVQTP